MFPSVHSPFIGQSSEVKRKTWGRPTLTQGRSAQPTARKHQAQGRNNKVSTPKVEMKQKHTTTRFPGSLTYPLKISRAPNSKHHFSRVQGELVNFGGCTLLQREDLVTCISKKYKGKLFVETKGRITLGGYIVVLLLKQKKVVSRYSAGCKHLISSWSPKRSPCIPRKLRCSNRGNHRHITKSKNRWSLCHGKLSKCLCSLKLIVRAWKMVVGRLHFFWEGLFFGCYVGYLGMYSRQDMLDIHSSWWSLLGNRYS